MVRSPNIFARDTCASDPRWQLSKPAWQQANTDNSSAVWWSKQPANASFANQLAAQFGGQDNDFSCGINDQGKCILPDCTAYVDANHDPWTYLALCAVVNVDTFLNMVYEAISNGQNDFEDLANAMAQKFFPWKEPQFGREDVINWVGATIGPLFSFLGPEGRAVDVAVTFIAAGTQEVELQIQPDEGLTLLQGIGLLTEAATQSAEQAREAIEKWATTLFSRKSDALKNTLLDYMRDGNFIASTNYTNADLETFWRDSMICRSINAQWRTQAAYLTFAYTTNSSIDAGPENTKYYSASRGGVYYMYQWKKSRLQAPDGLLDLPSSPWNIQMWEPTMAAALSFEVAGFNYTPAIALDRLKGNLFNTMMSPASNGAHTEGLWTLPVCNMTDFVEWNGQYDKDHLAPCCCGEQCQDTKTFVELANLKGDQSYLRQCKRQLKQTNIDFNSVDYGFKPKLSTGQIMGIVIGSIIGGIIAVPILFYVTCFCVGFCAGLLGA